MSGVVEVRESERKREGGRVLGRGSEWRERRAVEIVAGKGEEKSRESEVKSAIGGVKREVGKQRRCKQEA